MRLATIVLAVVVCGCSHKPDLDTSAARPGPSPYEVVMAECGRLKPTSPPKMLPSIECLTRAEVEGHKTSGGPALTWALEYRVAALKIAEDHDAGRMSDTQAEAQLELLADERMRKGLQFSAEIAAADREEAERDRARRLALVQAGLEIMRGPPTVTCNTFGNTTQCRGN